MRLIFHYRHPKFMLYGNWYSFYRFTHPYTYENGERVRLVDFGAFTFGYGRQS